MKKELYRNSRAIKIAKEAIDQLNVNLSGLTILTEVGSNNYLFTPIIAALAGAEIVYAWVKDSSYGKAEDIKRECLTIANELNITNILITANKFVIRDVSNADMITNSGALRPINKQFLEYAKKDCVIPLMYEAWEIREGDIDLSYCSQNGISVAGTWENHPAIMVFEYGGSLAIKLALESGLEIFDNRILVWSDDHFGDVASSFFKKLDAKEVIVTTDISIFEDHMQNLDFVYICDYDEQRNYFGETGIFSIELIKEKNPNLMFIHLFGNVSKEFTLANGLNIYPEKEGKASVMTETLGYVGLEPIIKLQVAGFKVGEELKNKKLTSLSQLLS